MIFFRTLFVIAALPNIVNGFHVSSYVFVGKVPEFFWCEIPALSNTSWTHNEMLHITSKLELLPTLFYTINKYKIVLDL